MTKRAKASDTKSLRPPEGQPWSWMTNNMLGCITFRALSINARRILDFLLYEHASHAGRQNGNLGATYKQLEAWGVTAADVRKGLQELYVCGFVRLTHQGLRQAGGGDQSRYALTWLPTLAGSAQGQAPTHDWAKVIQSLQKDRVGTVAAARAWLRCRVAGQSRAKATRPKREPTPHLQVVSPITCEARAVG